MPLSNSGLRMLKWNPYIFCVPFPRNFPFARVSMDFGLSLFSCSLVAESWPQEEPVSSTT